MMEVAPVQLLGSTVVFIKKLLALAAALLLAIYLAPYLVGQEPGRATLVQYAPGALAIVPTGAADRMVPLWYRVSSPARLDIHATGVGIQLDSLEPAIYTVTVENATHVGTQTVVIRPGSETVLPVPLSSKQPNTQLARVYVREARTHEPVPDVDVYLGEYGSASTDSEGGATFAAVVRGTSPLIRVQRGDVVVATKLISVSTDSSASYEILMGLGVDLKVTNGLQAWYPLDAYAPYLDAGPFGRNAEHATSGPGPAVDRFGVAGGAIRFDGVTSAITIPDADWQKSVPLSVSFWMRTDSATARTAMFLGKYLHATGDGWLVFYEGGLLCAAHISDNFLVYSRVNTLTTIDGRWHHVVVTITESQLVLYVDGARVPSNRAKVSMMKVTTNEPIRIGRIRSTMWPDHAGLIGAMDDVAFYNRILTDEEILLLAQ